MTTLADALADRGPIDAIKEMKNKNSP